MYVDRLDIGKLEETTPVDLCKLSNEVKNDAVIYTRSD